MRYFIMIFLSCIMWTQCAFSQDEEGYSREQLQSKLKSFTALRTTGLVLLGVGAASTITGIVLMSNANWETQNSSTGVQATTKDATGGAGIICLAVGIPFTIGGAIISLIANGKVKEYRWRVETLGSAHAYQVRIVFNY